MFPAWQTWDVCGRTWDSSWDSSRTVGSIMMSGQCTRSWCAPACCSSPRSSVIWPWPNSTTGFNRPRIWILAWRVSSPSTTKWGLFMAASIPDAWPRWSGSARDFGTGSPSRPSSGSLSEQVCRQRYTKYGWFLSFKSYSTIFSTSRRNNAFLRVGVMVPSYKLN